MTAQPDRGDTKEPAPHISLFGRTIRLPRSRALRVGVGVALLVLGVFGFLPVLGFWMIPLGVLVLSHEFHLLRRMRRRTVVSWERRKERKNGRRA